MNSGDNENGRVGPDPTAGRKAVAGTARTGHGAVVAVWHVLASDPCSEPAAHRPPFSAPLSDQAQLAGIPHTRMHGAAVLAVPRVHYCPLSTVLVNTSRVHGNAIYA